MLSSFCLLREEHSVSLDVLAKHSGHCFPWSKYEPLSLSAKHCFFSSENALLDFLPDFLFPVLQKGFLFFLPAFDLSTKGILN